MGKRTMAVLLVVLMLLTIAPMSGLIGADLVLRARASYSVGDTIQFGTYPQTRVTDDETILKLNDIKKTWTSYKYYIGSGNMWDGLMTQQNYMYFADFFCEGTKYRAVRFDKYRPYSTWWYSSPDYSYQNNNGYTLNRTYYFIYEPLTWKILDPSSGLIWCEKSIDAQAYQNTDYLDGNNHDSLCYQDYTCSVYANDYAESSIRRWLNNSFYNTAFTETQKANIEITTINNDGLSEDYNSASTNDKVFLLSYADVTKTEYGFSSSISAQNVARRAQGTDYAKCQGLFYARQNDSADGCTEWWLRTPGSSSRSATKISYVGTFSEHELYGYVHSTATGVRPVCVLGALTDDLSVSSNLYSVNTHFHINGSPVVENEIAATCTSTGKYDTVVYCSGCGIERSRRTTITDAIPHTQGAAVEENIIPATCTSTGSYDKVIYCTVCFQELSRTTFKTNMVAHSSGEPTIENIVEPTCTKGGSYDEVVYCTVCNNELSRISIETDATGIHTYGSPVVENKVEATCVKSGKYDEVVYCTVCKGEMSRKEKSIPATGVHRPGESTRENVIGATFTEYGSYDEVVRCIDCGEELSRETKPIAKIPHDHEFILSSTIEATCAKDGALIMECTICNATQTIDIPATRNHVDLDNDGLCDTCEKQMTGNGRCNYCGQIHSGFAGFFTKILHWFMGLFGKTMHEVVS